MTLRGLTVFAVVLLLCTTQPSHSGDNAADSCEGSGLRVQVLGSGGGELSEGRAASGYVLWLDGKARAVVDFGPGAALRFGATGARAADLDVILLSHLHADHTLDLPMLIANAGHEKRNRPLPLYGPVGNQFAPSTVTFVRTLLDGTRGAYRHLGEVLSPLAKNSFKLDAHDVRLRPGGVGVRREDADGIREFRPNERLEVAGTYVIHGGYPSLAWRISAGGRNVVFTGDMNGEGGTFERIAQKADLMIAHHAIPEGTGGVDRYAHMPPSVIGRLAAQSNVKRLVLTHRTRGTLGQEDASLAAIRARYAGPVVFADDLNCFAVP